MLYVTEMLTATTVTAGNAFAPDIAKTSKTFQATGSTSSGAGAATIKIQVSNDGTNWIDLGTITLTLGTAATSDGFAAYASWASWRANVTAISGTGASVTVTMAG